MTEVVATPYEDPAAAYRRGVNDLLKIAQDGVRALRAGAINPHGVGLLNVHSFVNYLTDQAALLKEKSP